MPGGVHVWDSARGHRGPVDTVSPLLIHMNGGSDPGHLANHTGSVAVPGEVFRHVYVAWPQALDGAITQADFRLPGQGDDVLSPRGSMPVAKRTGGCRTEHHTLGVLECS